MIEPAWHSSPAEEISNVMNPSPDAIRKVAIRLGVSLSTNPRQAVDGSKTRYESAQAIWAPCRGSRMTKTNLPGLWHCREQVLRGWQSGCTVANQRFTAAL